MRGILKAAGLTALVSLAVAPAAWAGKFHLYSCRTPAGESAPADGWSGSPGPVYDDHATNTCAGGGALTAALGDLTTHIANVDQATWTFSVPAGESMKEATLWRAGDVDGGASFNASYELWLAGPTNNSIFDDCSYEFKCPTGVGDPTQPLSVANRVYVPGPALGAHLYANAACSGSAEFECPAGHDDSNGYAAVVYLYAADVILEQTGGPTAKEVSGPLAMEKTVQGTSDLVFNASDPGAGVWEASFSVDGKVVQSTVPNENGGRCRDVGQTTDGLPAFLYLQPCLASESVDVPFDTTAVSNGTHHLVVSVLDPAGNSAPVLDREIDVENPVAPVVAQPKPAVKRTLSRRVRAHVTLRIAPRHVGRYGTVHFSGRLLGGHIPRGGKLLVLEARQGRGKWLKFFDVRTGVHGRFHGSYRFEFLGPGRWQIRALCEGQANDPLATGWSNVVRVRVF
jgi:hypothetical protein